MDEKEFLESLGGTYGPSQSVSSPIADSQEGQISTMNNKPLLGKVFKGAADIGIGFAKGAADTVLSVPKNIEKVIKDVETTKKTKSYAGLLDSINTQNQKLISVVGSFPEGDPRREKYMKLIKQNQEQADVIRNDFYGVGGVQDTIDNAGMTKTIDNVTTTKNGAQKFGKGAEKLGEFFVGGSAAAKLIPKGTNAVTRIAANTAKGALGAALPTLAEDAKKGQFDTKEGTKNALEEAGTAALVGGGSAAVLSSAGEVLRKTKLPAKIMGSVYKTDKKEIAHIFNEVDDATIQTGTKAPTVKLSQWAVDKGLKGSLEDQAHQVQKILKASEENVVASAAAAKKTIPVEPNLVKLAQKLKADFANSGRGEIMKNADDFLNAAKDGNVSVKDALIFRRVLDGLRTKGSFINTQAGDDISYWAEDLRKAVNSIDDIGAINKDYAMAIKAREALIKEATARGNDKAVGALEAYAVGFGGPKGAAIVGAKRIMQTAKMKSAIAQSIQNGKPKLGLRIGLGKIAGDQKRKQQEQEKISELTQ